MYQCRGRLCWKEIPGRWPKKEPQRCQNIPHPGWSVTPDAAVLPEQWDRGWAAGVALSAGGAFRGGYHLWYRAFLPYLSLVFGWDCNACPAASSRERPGNATSCSAAAEAAAPCPAQPAECARSSVTSALARAGRVPPADQLPRPGTRRWVSV